MSTLSTFYGPPRRVSAAGRELLAAAVTIDHDWSLTFSSVDMLIEAVHDLTDEDLEAAYVLASHIREAIACVEIRRQTAQLPPPVEQTTGQRP